LALTGVNGVIIIISGFLSYFLSGKTLQPIKEVFEKQDKFLSDASHELRTPLTSLKTSIEVGLRDKDLSLSEAKKVLADNLSDVDNLSRLANSLLELSVSNSKKTQLDNSIVASKELLDEAIRLVSSQAKSKNIIIIKKSGNFDLLVDREKIIRVLVIVLDNAIKYSPPKSKIKISTLKNSKYVVFCIKDQGCGIKQEEIKKVFDRFYRGDTSRTNSSQRGYGLGLSIAKEITDSHMGYISVSSKAGQGSVFNVALPTGKNI